LKFWGKIGPEVEMWMILCMHSRKLAKMAENMA